MPICMKCNKKFPIKVFIDGKEKNLQRRKYCLECSPFGSHNTSKLHIEKSQSEEEEKKAKIRAKRVLATQKRREKVKQMAVDYKGGKCCVCGYDKYVGALDFHHINPEEKIFGIGSRGYTRSWEEVKKELDKCVLVCKNCHCEIHAGLIDASLFQDVR